MKREKKRIITLSSVIAVALILMIVVTTVMYNYREYMDQFLGAGTQKVTATSEGLTADYIDFTSTSDIESRDSAAQISLQTAEEGIILLRNDDKANGVNGKALPLVNSSTEASAKKVTILGYKSWHNNMAGGEDPATTENAVSIGAGLGNYFDTNEAVIALYESATDNFADPAAALDGVKNTFTEYNTAVVTISRNSGEGNDQERDLGAAEYNRTGLSLKNAELALIDYACKNFTEVIVVINAANTMELGFLDPKDSNYKTPGMYTDPYSGIAYDFSKIVGAYWAGSCGSQGGTALAKILSGDVNPSGHTPDIYVRTLRNDPTYYNFGNFEYTNGTDLDTYLGASVYFVEYEEGIYMGYRYYETAAYEALQGNYSGYDYDENVVYPFGYGLSYTDFSMEYASTPVYDSESQEYTFEVKVTNTGAVAGKGVAQIYVNAPWEKGQVEKSHVVLVGFDKTQELEPGASETLTIKVSRDYFTSYDYTNEKAYILDQGDYTFYLSENSHSWTGIDKSDSKLAWTQTIDSKLVFNEAGEGKRSTDNVVATNVLDDEMNYKFKAYGDGSTGDGYVHDFTRSDFAGSFPTAPEGDDLIISDERTIKEIEVYDVWDDSQNEITEMPETNTDETSYTLVDLRGVDINDKKWDDYINQFTVESMAYMFMNGGWNEMADTENGVPKSYDADSPYGFYAAQLKISSYARNVWYCGGPMVAATYNTELAEAIGEAFGEEAWQFKQEDGQAITGLYGYGANTHRSAFGGRNYEYYSEDAVLAGKMAAAETAGASEKGLITFMKHYALNEQELNRQANGYCSWANEQAFREIYNKSFEIYMKESKMTVNYYEVEDEADGYTMASKEMSGATGLMTAYNRIGATYAGASAAINKILRDECGFTGTILSDAGGEPNTYMTTDYSLRRGQNLTLTNNGTNGLYDTESATAIHWLKESTKYLLYNKANSNAVMGLAPGDSISYNMSPWQIILNAVWAVVGALSILGIIYCIMLGLGKVKLKEIAVKQKNDDNSEY